MKYAFTFILCCILSACATRGVQLDREMIPVVKYVMKIPPAELLTLPPAVGPIDIDSARQSDVAAWIIRNEERMQQLENLLKGVANFLSTEQDKLDAAAHQENAVSAASAASQQLNRARVVTPPTKK